MPGLEPNFYFLYIGSSFGLAIYNTVKVMGEGGLISIHTVNVPKLSHDMFLILPSQNRLFLRDIRISPININMTVLELHWNLITSIDCKFKMTALSWLIQIIANGHFHFSIEYSYIYYSWMRTQLSYLRLINEVLPSSNSYGFVYAKANSGRNRADLDEPY